MRVQDHTAYKKSRELATLVWNMVKKWDKSNILLFGNQLIRAADSVSANLSEGWNRYSKRDKVNFFIIARGSLAETSDWLEKAFERKLVDDFDYKNLCALLIELPKDINGLIKGTKENLKI